MFWVLTRHFSRGNNIHIVNPCGTTEGFVLFNSYYNDIRGGIINGSCDGGPLFIESSFYNNFTNITVINTAADSYDLNIYSGSNFTYLIDMPYIGNYSINNSIVYVKKTGLGEVRFLQAVNGSGTNFSADILIQNNSATVRSDVNSGLNKSANITLYGLPQSFTNPVILKNKELRALLLFAIVSLL